MLAVYARVRDASQDGGQGTGEIDRITKPIKPGGAVELADTIKDGTAPRLFFIADDLC